MHNLCSVLNIGALIALTIFQGRVIYKICAKKYSKYIKALEEDYLRIPYMVVNIVYSVISIFILLPFSIFCLNLYKYLQTTVIVAITVFYNIIISLFVLGQFSVTISGPIKRNKIVKSIWIGLFIVLLILTVLLEVLG